MRRCKFAAVITRLDSVGLARREAGFLGKRLPPARISVNKSGLLVALQGPASSL